MTDNEVLEQVARAAAREAKVKAVLESLTTVRVWNAQWRVDSKAVRATVCLESKSAGSITLVTEHDGRGLYVAEQDGVPGAQVLSPSHISLAGYDLDDENGVDGRKAARARVRRGVKKHLEFMERAMEFARRMPA